MRILIVNTLYPPSTVGGAEVSVQLLAHGLLAAGHDVTVACVHDELLSVAESDDGVAVRRFPLRNSHWPFDTTTERSAWERLRWHVRDQWNRTATDDLIEVIDEVRPDVINTNNLTGFSTEVWRIADDRSIPIVHTLRDYSLVCSRSTLFDDGAQCERRCSACWALSLRKQRNSASVDGVVAISSAVIDQHRRFGWFEDTTVERIHDVVAIDEPTIPAPLEGVPVFGFLGRVEEEKGIDVLLAASAALADRPHRVRIGGRGDAAEVERLRASFPHAAIEWLGHVDVDEFFASIDTLVVAPVWQEPMGRTVLEAALRGVSIIHSDAGGVPEIAATTDAHRVEVRAGDIGALADAMRRVIADIAPWRKRTPASPAAMKPFSEEHVIERNVDLFERVIAARASS